jgi:hypothetical protein
VFYDSVALLMHESHGQSVCFRRHIIFLCFSVCVCVLGMVREVECVLCCSSMFESFHERAHD